MALFSLTLALSLTAGPVTIAAPGFTGLGEVSVDSASFYAEHFATHLGTESQLDVITRQAVAGLIGLERQRQLLGCASAASECLAELSGALGARAVLVGEVAKLDRTLQVNLRVVEVSTARTIHQATVRAATQEELLDALDGEARRAAASVRRYFKLDGPSAAERWPALAVSGVGVVTLGVGAVFLAQAGSAWATLGAPATTALGPDGARQLAQQGSTQLKWGVGLAAAGAVVLAGGLTWFGLSGRVQVTVALTPAGGGLMLAWGLP